MKKVVPFITLGLALLALSACSQQNTETTSSSVEKTEQSTSSEEKKTESAVPTEYKNALKSAENYLKFKAFSKRGLYDQLTADVADKYPAEAAQYAVDNIKADWNEQALRAAKEYQKLMPMSNEGLKEQLTSDAGDKYTEEEADYAVAHLE